MDKICFLLDPDKKEVENVFNACVRLQDILDKSFLKQFVEYWVGGTGASGDEVRKWLEKLHDRKIGPRLIYPAKISQFVLGYQYVNYALVPYLLNWTDVKVFIYNLIGILISKLYKRKRLFGYLVMSNKSTVGKKVGARNLSNKNVIDIVKRFLNQSSSKVIYLEAGSGVKKPIEIGLVKEVSKIMKSYKKSTLIVGGGIKTSNKVKALFSAGADKLVIGTALEQESVEKSLKVMLNLLKPLKVNVKNNLNNKQGGIGVYGR